MFTRVVIAVTGAAAITGGMLFAMNEVAKTFRERDSTRYFRITDVIIPEGRRLPERPAEAQRAPERARPSYDTDRPRVEGPRVEAPRIDVPPPIERPNLEPQLDPELAPDRE